MNVVQAGASIAVAAPAAQARNAEPVRLQIERIGLDLPLVPVGLDENHTPVVPKHDAAWYTRSARPGEHENMVFWGHALRFEDTPDVPAPFEQLRHLAVGDSLRVYAADGSVRSYVIVRQVWALPHEVEYIRPHGEEEVTIVCCIGDTIVVDGELTMTHRLITIAHPIQTS
jgi:LPXTG-site transpeptidase (sortase) family protein